MRQKFAHILIVVALVLAIGAPWAVLQTVAWVGMAVSYSQDAPLATALEKTFDGRHQCELCKAVQEGKRTEKARDLLKLGAKLDYSVPPLSRFLVPHAPRLRFLIAARPATRDAESPPTPPPRPA
ncbi:MAG: hypothetical protein HYR88_16425 [Verrucomicrobia bacterium]|nr:hypothetical protein [Verrucomicrobiota bacterium]